MVKEIFQFLPFRSMNLADLLDTAIIAYIIYKVFMMIKGTRAAQILKGIFFILILYAFSIYVIELTTLRWIIDKFIGYIFLAVIILFQPDIRKGLSIIGAPLFGGLTREEKEELCLELQKATFLLSNKRIGAIMAIERGTSLVEFEMKGTVIDAKVSTDIIVSIFDKRSPLHDGAIIIRGGRISSAGAFFPLSTNPDIDRSLGTRHRAGIGLTEETDAIVIVVSEERGSVAVCSGGSIHFMSSEKEFFDTLIHFLKAGRDRRIFSLKSTIKRAETRG